LGDLSGLADYAFVKSLYLGSGHFSDLSPLSAFQNLEELELYNNRNITDISPLESLIQLRRLTLLSCPNIQSIQALSTLTNLQYLRLASYDDMYYKELAPLWQLEILVLEAGVIPELDLRYIAQLTSLKVLVIDARYKDGVRVNIELLRSLVNLERLILAYNSVETLDLNWIKSLQKLNYLGIKSSAVDDLRPLLALPNLTEVLFDYTKVKDLSVLLESRSIKQIWEPEYQTLVGSELAMLFFEKGISVQSIRDR
jgi:Leucine-rich repeat (LRR) protein